MTDTDNQTRLTVICHNAACLYSVHVNKGCRLNKNMSYVCTMQLGALPESDLFNSM